MSITARNTIDRTNGPLERHHKRPREAPQEAQKRPERGQREAQRGTTRGPERGPEAGRREIERGDGGNLAAHFFEVASEIFAMKHLPPEMHQKLDLR